MDAHRMVGFLLSAAFVLADQNERRCKVCASVQIALNYFLPAYFLPATSAR
jgi:hypothetical protein